MSKKLKIKFWRTERALAMQVVEQEGLPEHKMHGAVVLIDHYPDLYSDMVELRGTWSLYDFKVAIKHFSENQKRDEYLDKITQAITDELFTSNSELKIGEKCEVREDGHCIWSKYKLLAILPEEYDKRYIVSAYNYHWMALREARPLAKRTEPKVEECGDIITYTWEEE